MAIFFREFEISDPGGDKIHFKHYPNQGGPGGKLVYEENTIDITTHATQDMLAMIAKVHEFMSENTMDEISIKEGED